MHIANEQIGTDRLTPFHPYLHKVSKIFNKIVQYIKLYLVLCLGGNGT